MIDFESNSSLIYFVLLIGSLVDNALNDLTVDELTLRTEAPDQESYHISGLLARCPQVDIAWTIVLDGLITGDGCLTFRIYLFERVKFAAIT